MTRISSPERGRCERSSSDSVARSVAGDVAAPPRVRDGEDRRLGAADGELLDDGARDRLAVRPRRELLDLGREIADVVPDRLDERAARVAVGRRTEPRELLADPLRQLLLARPRTCALRRPCATAFASAESFLTPSPTSTRTVSGAGEARYASTSLTSAAFHASTPSTTTARDSPPKSPSELQAETASAPDASEAWRCSVASSPIARPEPLERERDLRPVAPREEVDRLQRALVRHAAKHRRLPRPRPGRGRRPSGPT